MSFFLNVYLFIYLYTYLCNNYIFIYILFMQPIIIYIFVYLFIQPNVFIYLFMLILYDFFYHYKHFLSSFFPQHLSWLGLGPCRHYATYFGWPMVSVVLNVYLIWIVLNSTPIWRSKNSLSSSIYNFFHSCCLGANTPMMYMSWDRLVRWGGEGVGILGY